MRPAVNNHLPLDGHPPEVSDAHSVRSVSPVGALSPLPLRSLHSRSSEGGLPHPVIDLVY